MMLTPKNLGLLNDMFDDPFFTEHESGVMRTDIKNEKDKYSIDIDLPGYDKNNIKIDINNGYLTIKANIDINDTEKENKNFIRKERYNGTCSRSFYIGHEIEKDSIKATYNNGVLQIEIPKHNKELDKPKKQYIEIE